MARPKLNLLVLDPGSGRARPFAWVAIYQANTLSLAALYADDDLTTLPNPVQADGLGQVAVRVATGLYDVSMTWEGSQPTLVEDVVAGTTESLAPASPGAIVIGGPGGSVVQLPVGAEDDVLVVDAGLPAWGPLGPGHGLPTAPPYSMVLYPAIVPGAVTPLAPGTEGQFLVMLGGLPTWATHLPAPPGTFLPISAKGDLVIGDAAGLPMRLPIGTAGKVLTVVSGTAAWADPTGGGGGDFESPMTTLGDLIVGGVAGAGLRLGVGAESSVLTVVAGVPTWAVPITPMYKVMVLLTPEGARLPDGTAGNFYPTPSEEVSATAPPANAVKIVNLVYLFAPSQQQTLLWKVAVPTGFNGATVEMVVKWRCTGILGQIRWGAALSALIDAATLGNAPVFNAVTLSGAVAVPGTAQQVVESRFTITDITGVAVGRALYVMLRCLEAVPTEPSGLVAFEEAWLEFSR